jgi:hypothetical protein
MTMEMMTINDFAQNQGKIYTVPLMDGSMLELRLTAVEARPSREKPKHWPQSLPFRDVPFSLAFLGPAGIRLVDGNVPMQDDSGRMLQIGLSAFAGDDNGIYYQAVFN